MIDHFTGPLDPSDRLIPSWREPVELIMSDDNACVSCVVANVMYMFGKAETPDQQAIDLELGRHPREKIADNVDSLFLLRQGFTMDFICEFDEEAFIANGLDYLKKYYKDTWAGPEFDTYWTPEMVRQRQTALRESREEFKVYSDQFTNINKQPTLEDIDVFLAEGKPVLACVYGNNGGAHQELIYGKEPDGWYKIYSPLTVAIMSQPLASTLTVCPPSYLKEILRADEGIVGLSLVS